MSATKSRKGQSRLARLEKLVGQLAEAMLGDVDEERATRRTVVGKGRVEGRLRELFGKPGSKSKRGNPVFHATAGELPAKTPVILVGTRDGAVFAAIPRDSALLTIRNGRLVRQRSK